MAWIESHQTLGSHPKTRKAALRLGITLPQMVGHLHFLWWWALDYAQDGDLSKMDALDVAIGADWPGDPEAFLDALVECGGGRHSGFVERDDDGMRLHDWMSYAGRLVEARRHAAGQKRKHRELYNDRTLCAAIRERDGDSCRYCGKDANWNDRRGGDGGTYDYVDPHGPTTLENLVVACRACNSGKNQRTPEQAGYVLLDPPDKPTQKPVGSRFDEGQKPTPTEPNTTQPNQPQKTRPAKLDPDPAEFVEFWSVYPRREAKGQARKAWATAVRKVDPATILAGAKRYRDLPGREAAFTKLPATWLNGECWGDEAPVSSVVPIRKTNPW